MNYDSAADIREYLREGLPGLKRLAADRARHNKESLRSLNEFILFGKIWIGKHDLRPIKRVHFRTATNGGSHEDVPQSLLRSMPEVVAVPSFISESRAVIDVGEELPLQSMTVCAECGCGWDLDTVDDVKHQPMDRGKPSHSWLFHERCASLAIERRAMSEFKVYAVSAGWKDPVMSPIPNEYMKSGDPWVTWRLPRGDIRIGWRRHVIHIDWMDIAERAEARALQSAFRILNSPDGMAWYDNRRAVTKGVMSALSADTLFPNEDCTKDGPLIHAHGSAKAIEFLKVLVPFGVRPLQVASRTEQEWVFTLGPDPVG